MNQSQSRLRFRRGSGATPRSPRWSSCRPAAARLSAAALVAAGALGSASPASAAFIFNGSLTADDGVQFFSFTLASPSLVHVSTSSFAAGGLLPVVSYWDGSGLFGGAQVGGGGGLPGDVVYDIDLTGSLPGNYWLALSQNPNGTSLDLPGGIPTDAIFDYAGQGNFTGGLYCSGPYSGGFFIAGTLDCEQRAGNWALGIDGTGVTEAGVYPQSVPTPATALLTLAGLAGLAGHRRRPWAREPSVPA